MGVALAAVVAAGCAPVPLLQNARVVPKGVTRVGLAGAAFLPTASETFYEPDGPGSGNQEDLRWVPLPHLVGWTRLGLGGGELQAAFQVPSFTMTLAGKLGIVGLERGSPFAMALGVDGGFSPVAGSAGLGGTLMTSVGLGGTTSLDLSVRAGTFTSWWQDLALTATAGVSFGQGATWHLVAGAIVPVRDATPGLYLAIGQSFGVKDDRY